MVEGPKKRVLIVDDEPYIGKVFGTKFRLSGFDVVTTTKGAEAIELIRTRHFDIVVLDLVMPDVNGFSVLDKVRTFSAVPVLIFTARPEIADFAMKLGANGTIAKPLGPDKLVEKVRQILDSGDRKESPPDAEAGQAG